MPWPIFLGARQWGLIRPSGKVNGYAGFRRICALTLSCWPFRPPSSSGCSGTSPETMSYAISTLPKAW